MLTRTEQLQLAGHTWQWHRTAPPDPQRFTAVFHCGQDLMPRLLVMGNSRHLGDASTLPGRLACDIPRHLPDLTAVSLLKDWDGCAAAPHTDGGCRCHYLHHMVNDSDGEVGILIFPTDLDADLPHWHIREHPDLVEGLIATSLNTALKTAPATAPAHGLLRVLHDLRHRDEVTVVATTRDPFEHLVWTEAGFDTHLWVGDPGAALKDLTDS